MNYFRSQKFRDIAGFTAALILSIACLVASVYHVKILIDLEENGVPTSATVINIERGARNSSWAIYRYFSEDDQEIIARDIFQRYIKRVNEGDIVTVIYHREDVEIATADLGLWTWQAPVIFLFGFLLLAFFGILIWHHRAT